MALSLVPFEEDGNILLRWWRNTARPFASLRSVWDEVYRGDSLLAPLGFAYLWVLVAIPLILLVGKLGLISIKAKMGPYVGMSLANTLQLAPGVLASFLVSPLMFMLLGGCVAHGLLWLLDIGARNRFRGTLRVLGYGYAWMLPFVCLQTAWKLYLLINPIAAIEGAPVSLAGFVITQLVVGIATFVFITSGLASLHRSAIWKAFLAALVAFGVVWVSDQVLILSANRLFISSLLANHEALRKEENTPKARIQRLIKLVERIQEDTQQDFRKVGLPAPPRAVDILTGGDWGAAIDLKQASESGFAPSCQIIYIQTIAALKGQVIHYSACLGEERPVSFNREPAPLLPPGSEAAAFQIRQNLTPQQREALVRAKSAFNNAIYSVASDIGPFEASRPRAPQSMHAVPEAPEVPVQSLPVVTPAPPPTDPNMPSREISRRLPISEVRQMVSVGHVGAMNELGRRLYFGQNEIGKEAIPVDLDQGAHWLTKAYEGGFRSADSCATLMVAYYTGKGASTDPMVAKQWASRAEEIRAAERRRNAQNQISGR